MVKIYAELEANIVSVERVKEYSEVPREVSKDSIICILISISTSAGPGFTIILNFKEANFTLAL